MRRVARFACILLALALLLSIVGPGSFALTRTQRQAILKSTVLILPLKFEGNNVKALWRGSGTIVDAKGLILTNYHVVDETGGWDTLGILITTRSDQRPEPAYRAEVAAKDPQADLAVIRIVSDPKGNPIDLSKLNLVPVPLGNADDLEIGDELSIFGYPGIGDDTITLTEGKVSGFIEEEGIKYRRAWIKTDASISGGNSGGAAVDENGKLVGVPTEAGPVDARSIADTNGDGVIDSNDSPVSAGGFINRLRPVNLAFSLIEQARKGGIKPGDKQPTPNSKSPNTLPKGASFSKLTFASRVDSKNKPLDPGTQFSSDITRLYAFADYSGMANGVVYTRTWSVDEEVVLEQASAWSYGAKGTFYQSINYGGDPLPEGEYSLKLTMGGAVVQTGSATVGKKRALDQPTPTPQPKGVTLSGYLVDADTGKGIVGGYVLVLKPGISVRQVQQDKLSEQVAAIGQTDKTGYFRTAPPLARGYTYSAIAIAEGYKTIAEDDALTIEATDPDETELDPIDMVRQ
jgi:S1-C subfamily serine protease